MTMHELKCWPKFFEAITDGRKRFDIRKNDRDYQVGDFLHLKEWDPDTKEYTGREYKVEVTYMTDNWLQPGHVAMSIDPVGV